VDREALQVPERGVADAKIVDVQAHTHAVQLAENPIRHPLVLNQHTFGDLQL